MDPPKTLAHRRAEGSREGPGTDAPEGERCEAGGQPGHRGAGHELRPEDQVTPSRISRRAITEVARDLFGVALSAGAFGAICQRASDPLAGLHPADCVLDHRAKRPRRRGDW
jgi:hypothetical protein